MSRGRRRVSGPPLDFGEPDETSAEQFRIATGPIARGGCRDQLARTGQVARNQIGAPEAHQPRRFERTIAVGPRMLDTLRVRGERGLDGAALQREVRGRHRVQRAHAARRRRFGPRPCLGEQRIGLGEPSAADQDLGVIRRRQRGLGEIAGGDEALGRSRETGQRLVVPFEIPQREAAVVERDRAQGRLGGDARILDEAGQLVEREVEPARPTRLLRGPMPGDPRLERGAGFLPCGRRFEVDVVGHDGLPAAREQEGTRMPELGQDVGRRPIAPGFAEPGEDRVDLGDPLAGRRPGIGRGRDQSTRCLDGGESGDESALARIDAGMSQEDAAVRLRRAAGFDPKPHAIRIRGVGGDDDRLTRPTARRQIDAPRIRPPRDRDDHVRPLLVDAQQQDPPGGNDEGQLERERPHDRACREVPRTAVEAWRGRCRVRCRAGGGRAGGEARSDRERESPEHRESPAEPHHAPSPLSRPLPRCAIDATLAVRGGLRPPRAIAHRPRRRSPDGARARFASGHSRAGFPAEDAPGHGRHPAGPASSGEAVSGPGGRAPSRCSHRP